MSDAVVYDLLGNEIRVGSVVAASYYQSTLTLFEVTRIDQSEINSINSNW